MRRLWIVFVFVSYSCHHHHNAAHIEALAKQFVLDSVFPKMKAGMTYAFLGAKMDTFTVADYINDYKYVYQHLSYNPYDSMENKRHLDSISYTHIHLDSVMRVTVNVAYRTTFKRGNARIDSIRLGYNKPEDQIVFWPF